jgi:hypothetical protein
MLNPIKPISLITAFALKSKFMQKLILLVLILMTIGCNNNTKSISKLGQNDLVGTWHLTTKGQDKYHKGVIMYNADGQMSVILNHKDSAASGYSGRYEVNEKEAYVKHYRDYYSLLPFTNDSLPPVWIRDFKLSEDKRTLTLSPREDRSFSLVWERVPQ